MAVNDKIPGGANGFYPDRAGDRNGRSRVSGGGGRAAVHRPAA
jgi:hypothetical protein